eukprot:m.406567 g.406567  ORF g.406567 m.406567 type:complete len:538 (-) comp56497_c0_seq1:1069-2682(-)
MGAYPSTQAEDPQDETGPTQQPSTQQPSTQPAAIPAAESLPAANSCAQFQFPLFESAPSPIWLSFDFVSPASAVCPVDGQALPAEVVLFKQVHRKALPIVEQAIEFESTGRTRQAIQAYEEAFHELVVGTSINLDSADPRVSRYRATQEKMRTNQQFVAERLAALKLTVSPGQSSSVRRPTTTSASSPASSSISVSPSASASVAKQPVPSQRPGSTGTLPRKQGAKSAEPKEQPGKSGHLANIDEKMAHRILNEVVDKNSTQVSMDDVIGLRTVKTALRDAVVLPAMRPELFTGIRAPPKGLLLFGPPGNGKTLIAKAIAHEAKATFFNVSAGLLVSKYLGDGEKMVQALFAMAKELQPSIIFIDEIDSILTKRGEGEHEASRRIKTELLVCMDGVGSSAEDRVLVIGATNLPHELDDAVLRRLPKRIHIPLPDPESRLAIIQKLLEKVSSRFSKAELDAVVRLTEGYSGSDITATVREASFFPLRELGDKLISVSAESIRPIGIADFQAATRVIRPSVSQQTLSVLEKWNAEFGTA